MSESEQLFARAENVIPGGVNSPVRSFSAMSMKPIYFKRGAGAYLYDQDDKAYIDYVGSWGPMLLGHAHPEVMTAIEAQLKNGLSFGACCELEVEFAEQLCQMLPSLEMVRAVNSGTEATMTAIRLARGFTGRNKILKFTGCYHGHVDSLLVKAGSGVLTLGIPGTPGIPEAFTQHTLLADYNDLAQVKTLMQEYGDDVAAIIVEPVAGNMGCIPPADGFLAGLREVCDQHQSLLIFDEVMTGFRVGATGAQGLYNITPDLTTLAKIIGQGLPLAAFGGRRDVMQHLAPAGPVYQAGTLSGNPVCLSAGLAGLRHINQHPELYDDLAKQTNYLLVQLQELATSHQIPLATTQVGSMFGLYFADTAPTAYRAVDNDHYQHFFQAMVNAGVYFAPSAYESGFVSIAHDKAIIDKTLQAAETVFAELATHL